MSLPAPSKAPDAPQAPGSPILPVRRELPSVVGVSGALVVLVFFWPSLVSDYWLQASTSAVVYSIVALSLVVLLGRVGMISLCQIALLAVGGWVALRLGFATQLPFILVVLATGVITGVIGTLIGLPALRLTGLHLALVTLMAAAAITVVLGVIDFPNGGPGFLGRSTSSAPTQSLARPAIAADNAAYFRYATIVAVLVFLVVLLQLRAKPGRAWAAIRQSPASAVAAGINVTTYRLWAFALASFMTGIAGACLAASSGGITTFQFPTQDSIILLAAVLMGGAYSMWGAVVAALLMKLMPALLDTWGLSSDLLLLLFGIGIVQTMLKSPLGIAGQMPDDVRRLWTRLCGRRPDDDEAVGP